MTIHASPAHEPSNLSFTNVGLTGISGAATTYSTSATALQYTIAGAWKSKTQVSGGTTPTTDGNTGVAFVAIPKGYGCCFVWAIDAAGTYAVFQGPLAALDSAGNFRDTPPQQPSIPDTHCVVAYVIGKAGATYAGTGFKHGSDNWNTTGMTWSVVSVAFLPRRPAAS